MIIISNTFNCLRKPEIDKGQRETPKIKLGEPSPACETLGEPCICEPAASMMAQYGDTSFWIYLL